MSYGDALGVGFPTQQANFLVDTLQSNIAAAGNQFSSSATQLLSDVCVLGSVSNASNDAFLARTFGPGFKRTQTVINRGGTGTVAMVYAPTGYSFCGASVYSIANNSVVEFVGAGSSLIAPLRGQAF